MVNGKSGAATPNKGQAWFCTTGLPSDVVVEVDDMTFHLHKFPLMSKSKKLHDLIKEQEANKVQPLEQRQDTQNDDVESEEDEDLVEQEQCHVSLTEFPGGSETFEAAAKFCYGVKIDLTAAKVAPLRCAGEVLEMTEEYSEDNLISKTERYLTNTVLKNIKDSVKALKSCECLSPLSENLDIVNRCIDAISSKASLYDPTLFGWPVNDVVVTSSGGSRKKNATSTKMRDAWVEDLAQLSSSLFNRVISSMKEKEVNPEIIESCLFHYAKRCFPGISRSNRKPTPSSSMMASEAEQRQLLETIISNLPPEKSSRSQAATRFLFGLLRTANILNASEACKSALEKKIGAQLEQATLDDLLIPSYSYLTETLYDVDCIERILGHFLADFEEREIEGDGDQTLGNARSPAIMLVGKLIDGYLSEIASDSNLKPQKFIQLALLLPEKARLYDDGVYRAVDVYLKAHPWLSEEDREKISGVMDCQKLTLEACTHAAQNERLPLRAVVQVLFFEQLQLRHAIAGTLITADIAASESARPSVQDEDEGERDGGDGGTGVGREQSTWREAIRENQVLRLDMDSMRTRVHELERECSTMKRVIQKIDKVGSASPSWRSTITRKFGCKFKTQVCDSHESTVVENRKGRHHTNQR
ncbi:BTB/POZ domain-containing protein At5g66560-like [Chenopodium quinoa]|uniref:Phototropic-responsive NPH3 family protein n=1 Tax=Chenopodium quinoa TaxID=63459 RepID=A0A803MCQ0_CHEQI|nr:BTB/POZ domain-containing protein At5g66560-like [Chenopodium quinoa]